MSVSNIRKTRLKKLESIKRAEINPYPIKTKRTHFIQEALIAFEKFSRAKTPITLVGRIRFVREHGGSTFLHFEDGSGRIQAYFKKDKLGEKKYKFFLNNFDIGDFIEVKGSLFKTKKGERTISVSDYKMLTKSLLPLPEKWHGLKDVEERFRKRYLDLIMNSEVRERFEMRSRIMEELRNILNRKKFIEVETPILQPIPGGAKAEPFKTYLNALKLNLYLRVAPELYLKQLLIGGFEKIFEIGRCFRNEGIDRYHNPDFTMLELYWAFQDRNNLMKFVEELITDLMKKTKRTLIISYQGEKINFRTHWEKIKFRDLIKDYLKIDIEKVSLSDLQKKMKELNLSLPKEVSKSELLDELYKKACLPNLIQPTFVIDHPIEMTVLAKSLKENPNYADRFQLVVGGIELINGFSELNDPIEQRERFKKLGVALERRDENFLEALEYGMPPAAGLGMGIDRLVMLLTDSYSLREAILFPTMRSK